MYIVIKGGEEIGAYNTIEEANAAIVALKNQGLTDEFSVRVTQ
jgi:hypothetical protein